MSRSFSVSQRLILREREREETLNPENFTPIQFLNENYTNCVNSQQPTTSPSPTSLVRVRVQSSIALSTTSFLSEKNVCASNRLNEILGMLFAEGVKPGRLDDDGIVVDEAEDNRL